MPVDEHARHQLYIKAVEVFGEQEAATLMDHLPPGGWSNLATKQDLLDLERRLKSEIVGELKSYILRTVLFANLGMATAFAAIAFTAAGLT